MRSTSFLVSMIVLASCSSRGTDERSPPASTSTSVAFTSQIPFARAASGFHLERGTSVDVGARARAGLRVKIAEGSIDIAPEGLDDVTGTLDRGSVVFRGVRAKEDLVIVSEGSGYEELRVLAEPTATFEASYQVSVDPARHALRVREGRAEIIDRTGRVVFGTAPAFAVDARGTRRDLAVELDGSRLTFRGDFHDLSVPIVVDPAWSTVASMSVARYRPGVLQLADGRVLAAGGHSTGDLSVAEIYDPVSNTWSNAGFMPAAGQQPELLQLPSGRVMVFGIVGFAPDGQVFFNPTTKTWSVDATRPLSFGYNTKAVWLSGVAKAAVTSGQKIQLYADATSTWSVAADIPTQRQGYALMAMPDGRMLAAGGGDFAYRTHSTADVYDPTTNTWSAAGAFAAPRSGSALRAIPGGLVAMIGGYNASSTQVSTVDIFDPTTKTWSAGPVSPCQEDGASVLSLPGNRIFAITDSRTCILDTVGMRWVKVSDPPPSRSGVSATTLSGGRVIVVGGVTSTALATVNVLTPVANGTSCSATYAGECASTYCVAGICCDSACSGPCQRCDASGSVGTCQAITGTPPVASACAPYAGCVAGVCATSCTSDASCSSGSYCATSACVPKKTAGATCATANECTSGFCTDGVCCVSACGGQCEACDVSGDGKCLAVAGKPRGTRAPCVDGDKVCGLVCDGKNRMSCSYLAAGSTPCGTNACSAGVETHASTCDGTGMCGDTPKSCGAYKCGIVACKSACGSNADCSSGNYCSSGACVPAPGLGSACKDATGCATGACVDGVCCTSATCGAGETCAATGKEGKCTRKAGIACTVDDQCATGHCTEGVCCDSTCTGQCESCAVPGQVGTCSPALGAPKAGKTACSSDSSDPCSAHRCDGKERASCATFVSDVECRAASCKDGSAIAPASCAGTGACPAEVKTSCGAYACDAAGKECRLACSVDGDCAATYRCVIGVCKPGGDACDAEQTTAVLADGTKRACAPYRCQGGACLGACATSDDCAPGFNCDGTACVAPPTEAASGGCSYGSRGSSALPLAALLIAFLFARRRSLPLVLLAIGCTSAPAERTSDAIEILARMPSMQARLGANGSLIRDGARMRLDAKGALSVHAPLDPRDALEIADPADPTIGAKLTFVDAPRAAAPTSRGGSIVHASAWAGLDLVRTLDARGVEDTILMRAPRDRYTLAYRVEPFASVASVRVREGRVELVEANGRARVGTERAFAVDARGVRRDGDVALDGSTVTFTFDLAGLVAPIAIDPAWTLYAETVTFHHDSGWAFLLPSGDVIAFSNGVGIDKWSSTTSTWTAAPAGFQHSGGAAVEVSPGKILLAGGGAPFDFTVADLFDASTGTVTALPPMSAVHEYARAVYLGAPVARALVIGGQKDDGTGSNVWTGVCELFDPVAKTWAAAPSLGRPHYEGAAVALAGGKALVVGGKDDSYAALSTVDLYDGVAKTWTARANMPRARKNPRAVALSSGKVLVLGEGTAVDLYDPTANSWTTVGTSPTTDFMAVTLLAGDRVLVAGGKKPLTGGVSNAAAVWDPTAAAFFATSPLARVREHGIALPIGAGRTMIVGGNTEVDGWNFGTEIFKPLANGAACGGPGDCSSLFCVDGVCCDKACGASCEACNVMGSAGTCKGVSGAPTTGHPSCAPYATCVSGACDAACTTDAECVAGSYCNGTACVAKKANGGSCAAINECSSGFCVDGSCCDTACDGQCEACDVTAGTCKAVTGAPHGTRTACAGDGIGTSCGPRCDGVARKACSFPLSTTTCGTNACASGIETHVRNCDGIGHCGDVAKACGAYACGATTCKTACTATADCSAGFVCKGSACIPAPGLGEACSSSAPCDGALYCTDGYCCGVAACETGKSCGLPAHHGECAKNDGQTCAADGECGSGSCVDGVCCDNACTGQCQACDVAGSIGKCTAVKGAPHGSRIACSSTTGEPCTATTCDGSDGSRCAGLPGVETACRTASCSAGVVSSAATCSAGVCGASTKTPCAPFACAGDACATSCTGDESCAPGFVCAGTACVKPFGQCSKDKTAVLDVDGKPSSCAPLLCKDGACLQTCATTDDCVPGTVCLSGQCVPPAAVASTDDGGGCAIGRSSFSGAGAFFALLAAAVCARRRASLSINRG